MTIKEIEKEIKSITGEDRLKMPLLSQSLSREQRARVESLLEQRKACLDAMALTEDAKARHREMEAELVGLHRKMVRQHRKATALCRGMQDGEDVITVTTELEFHCSPFDSCKALPDDEAYGSDFKCMQMVLYYLDLMDKTISRISNEQYPENVQNESPCHIPSVSSLVDYNSFVTVLDVLHMDAFVIHTDTLFENYCLGQDASWLNRNEDENENEEEGEACSSLRPAAAEQQRLKECSVFRLTHYDRKGGSSSATSFALQASPSLLFPTLQEAEERMRQDVRNKDERTYAYVIVEEPVGLPCRDDESLSVRVYQPDGTLWSTQPYARLVQWDAPTTDAEEYNRFGRLRQFDGRKPEEVHFKAGDVVEILCCKHTAYWNTDEPCVERAVVEATPLLRDEVLRSKKDYLEVLRVLDRENDDHDLGYAYGGDDDCYRVRALSNPDVLDRAPVAFTFGVKNENVRIS